MTHSFLAELKYAHEGLLRSYTYLRASNIVNIMFWEYLNQQKLKVSPEWYLSWPNKNGKLSKWNDNDRIVTDDSDGGGDGYRGQYCLLLGYLDLREGQYRNHFRKVLIPELWRHISSFLSQWKKIRRLHLVYRRFLLTAEKVLINNFWLLYIQFL